MLGAPLFKCCARASIQGEEQEVRMGCFLGMVFHCWLLIGLAGVLSMAFYSYVNEALSCDVILTVESLHACKAVLLAIIACVCS